MRIARTLSAAALSLSLLGAAALPVLANNTPTLDYSAYSIEQLESLIAKLQAKLTEMKKGSLCFVSNSDLSLGDGEGGELTEDVRRLQDFLSEKGFLKYKSTGYFGKMTRTALVAFQAQQTVGQTGIFDAATRTKAHAMTCQKGTLKKEKKEDKKEEKKEEKKEQKNEPVSSVRSITVSVDGTKVKWTADGKSAQGYKVVWSKTAGATYPPRDTDRAWYYGDSNASESSLEAFDGAGTYHVRVCEYVGGRCGTYSNQVQVSL